MAKKDYEGNGTCIYCLQGFEKNFLTNEHIIPYALNGELQLLRAVCKTCQKITGIYEQAALNADLLVPRLLLQFKRRDKKKIKLLPRVSLSDTSFKDPINASFDVQLPSDEYAQLISLPLFPRANILNGCRSADSTLTEISYFFSRLGGGPNGKRIPRMTTKHLAKPHAYATTVAKIAYCYAVAEIGTHGFDGKEIRELLLSKRDDCFNFVGNPDREGTNASPSTPLHQLTLSKEHGNVVAKVNLFASACAPTYEVYLGPEKISQSESTEVNPNHIA